MEIEAVRKVVNQCDFPDYAFDVTIDGRGAWYLQGHYLEDDVKTGEPETQFTRRWFLSPEMTRSEIVQTVFKCALTSMEHRTREFFRYQGEAVFGPHYDVDALWELCREERMDCREER
jgi:hypothetical protein